MIENPTIAKLTASVALELPQGIEIAYIVNSAKQLSDFQIQESLINYIEERFNDKKSLAFVNKYPGVVAAREIKTDATIDNAYLQKLREDGNTIVKKYRSEKSEKFAVVDLVGDKKATLALIEGILFGNIS